MQITQHLSLAEVTRSETAKRKGISNMPTPEHLENFKNWIPASPYFEYCSIASMGRFQIINPSAALINMNNAPLMMQINSNAVSCMLVEAFCRKGRSAGRLLNCMQQR
jgi:hypothetical protein